MKKLDLAGRQDLIKKLIEGANGIPNSLLQNTRVIQLMADSLIFNDELMNIELDKNLLKNKSQKLLKPFSGQEYTRVVTLQNRVAALKAAAALIKNYHFDSSTLSLFNAIGDLYSAKQTAITNLKNMFPTDWANNWPVTRSTIPINVAKIIYEKLQNVEQELMIRSYETKLQAAFAELLGPVAGHFELQEAKQAVLKTFLNSYSGAGQKSAKQITGGYISLNKDTIEQMLKELDNQTKKSFQGMVMQDPNNKFKVLFNMSVGGRSDQKIDASFTFHGEQLNVSVKNTNLADQTFYNVKTGTFQHEDISLQKTTPLLSFLLGLNNFQNDLGNHVLNILAWHGDDKMSDMQWIQRMRRQTIALLELQIMWSALTGQYQGRIMQAANILYVHDKANNGSPIIKLYDMVDILTKAYANGGIDITPDLEALSGTLTNKYIPDRQHPPKNGIQKRLTRLMFDIRQKRFSAYLRKSVLTNLT